MQFYGKRSLGLRPTILFPKVILQTSLPSVLQAHQCAVETFYHLFARLLWVSIPNQSVKVATTFDYYSPFHRFTPPYPTLLMIIFRFLVS